MKKRASILAATLLANSLSTVALAYEKTEIEQISLETEYEIQQDINIEPFEENDIDSTELTEVTNGMVTFDAYSNEDDVNVNDNINDEELSEENEEELEQEDIGDSIFTFDFSTKTITAYSGTDTKIIIPSHFEDNDGNIVEPEIISANLFKENTNIVSVEIPNSIKTIGTGAFRDCTNLKTVVMPNSLETISSYAFYNCETLENLTIPSVVTIAEFAFAYTTNLKKLTLPEGFTTFSGRNVFIASGVEYLYLPSTTTTIYYSTGFYDTNGTFVGSNIKQIVLNQYYSESPLSIDEAKWNRVGYLAYLDAGTFIQDEWVFEVDTKTITSYAGNASTIIIPSTFSIFDEYVWTPEILKSSLFSGHIQLATVEMPDTVKTIETKVFYDCVNLENIKLSDTLETIGTYAFYNCESIEMLTIPSVVTIGEYAFGYTTNLKKLTLPEGFTTFSGRNVFIASGVEYLNLPSTTSTIYYSTGFYDSNGTFVGSNIKQIVLSQYYSESPLSSDDAKWNRVGYLAYLDAGTLIQGDWTYNIGTKTVLSYSGEEENVVIPSEFVIVEGHESQPENLTNNLLVNHTQMTSVNIPDTIKTIGNNVFSGCTNLVDVKMPNSLESLGTYAFYNCVSITELEIPSVVTIGEYAFGYTTNLKKLVLPEGFTTFSGRNVFIYSGVEYLYLPSTTSTIYYSTGFYDTNGTFVGSNIKQTVLNQYYNESPVSSDDAKWNRVGYLAYLDAGTLIQGDWTYNIGTKTILSYSNEEENIVIPSEFVIVEGYASKPENLANNLLLNHTQLTSVNIPDTIKTIGNNVFNGCTNLVDVKMPNSLESLGTYAFYNCESITALEIPSVITIAEYAFANTTNLTKLVIPEGFTTFSGRNIFINSGVEDLYLPSTTSSIYFSSGFYDTNGTFVGSNLVNTFLNQYYSD